MAFFRIKQSSKSWAVFAWSFYDWANSVYPLIITTAIFPLYYCTVTPDVLDFIGLSFLDTELYTYTNCVSFIIVVLFSPILSGIADYLGNRKRFMQFFTYLGSFSCLGLFFFVDLPLFWGLLLILLTSVGYWGSAVFYNSYLPNLVPPRRQDSVSAQGYMLGYFGSCILLALCLWWISAFGAAYVHYCFLFVGVWWMGFAQFTFYFLPTTPAKLSTNNILLKGYKELLAVYREIVWVTIPNFKTSKLAQDYIFLFLMGFFFYSLGIQTFLLIATLFAQKKMGIPMNNLIISILIVQIIGLLGALIFSKISKYFGNIYALSLGLVIWFLVAAYIYFFSDPSAHLSVRILQFYAVSACVGLVMGGTQSLSRSTYSKLIPLYTQRTVSYFSFYDVTEKWSIVLGTFCFAFLEGLTGDMYWGLFLIALFLLVGIFIIMRIPNHLLFVPKFQNITHS